MNLNIILNDIFKEKILLASTADSEFQKLIIDNPECKDYLEYDIKLTNYEMFLRFNIKLLNLRSFSLIKKYINITEIIKIISISR